MLKRFVQTSVNEKRQLGDTIAGGSTYQAPVPTRRPVHEVLLDVPGSEVWWESRIILSVNGIVGI